MHRGHTWHDYPWPWVSLTWLLYNLQLWRHGRWFRKFTVRFRPIRKEIASSMYNNGRYYAFKIFPRFWLVKTTRIIHHKQLLLTKFAKNFVIFNRWRQKCSPLQIIEPLTEKTWGLSEENIFLMNNKAIIEFGFRMIWRILQISEGFIHLDLQNSPCPTQPHSIIAKYHSFRRRLDGKAKRSEITGFVWGSDGI